jgi:hypothetical protein
MEDVTEERTSAIDADSRSNESELPGERRNSPESDAQARRTADAVLRRSYGKLSPRLLAHQ